MTIDNRDDYIKYRFQRAEESFEEALILAEKERWNTVINGLAMPSKGFHSTSASIYI